MNKKKCVIRDIKDYYDGFFSKKILCKYLSEDLNIIAMTKMQFISIVILSCIILLVLIKII